ncbi:hypothetical protein DL98DRAFT_443136, partial [Cadophora sp. DSE1049]
ATCCLIKILANYKNFFKQKLAFKKKLLARGYKCLFLLKFYYELNLIEMYWAQAAFKALNFYPLDTLRRYINRASRFMDVYRKGLSVKQAA